MDRKDACACEAAPKLVFACSGAADVGAIADGAARKLTADGAGKMFCLAGVGGRVEPIMKTTKSAAAILAIDGCPMDCAKGCLEQAGFATFRHMRVTDMGMEKGKTAVTEDNVAAAAAKCAPLLQT